VHPDNFGGLILQGIKTASVAENNILFSDREW